MAATVSGVLLTGNHASRPAASAVSAGTLYSCTTHSLVYQSDGSSTWSTWATIGTSSTTVATDTIWDAAGDLAVGSGADTASKLSKGSAGGALSIINSAVAWNSGTSNPGSAAAGDRYWRTDLGFEVYYTGSIWLTTQMFAVPFAYQDSLAPNSATGGAGVYVALANGIYDVFIDSIICATNVLTTNNGSNYWTVQFQRKASATNVGSSFNTSADTAGTTTAHTVTVGALTGTTDRNLDATVTKTAGAPGNLYLIATVYYRFKIT